MMNWNACPRQKLALLMRASIDGVIDEVGPNSAEIKQRVSFGRSPVTHHRTPLVFCRDQELQKLAFGLFYFFAEAKVSLQIRDRASSLFGSQVLDSFFRPFAAIFLMPHVNSQRPPMSRKFVDVENGQSMSSHDLAHGMEREVREMLMVNRVKLILIHQAHQMWKLQGDHALAFKQDLKAFDKIIECRNMRQNIVADDQIGTDTLLHQPAGHGFTEKLYLSRDVPFNGRFCDIGRRLDPKNRDSFGDEMLQEIAIIASE